MNKNISLLIRSLLILLALVLVSALLLVGNYLAQPRPANAQKVDMKTQAIKWSGEGLKIELQSMPLDLVRAFFLGRGFNREDADLIAKTGCIFRSAIGHAGSHTNDPQIVIELSKWQVTGKADKHHPRTRQAWSKIWKTRKVSENARAAFYWALFPTRQSYQASDYNWGMISFALPPGSQFDLKLHWLNGNKEHTKMLTGLECGK